MNHTETPQAGLARRGDRRWRAACQWRGRPAALSRQPQQRVAVRAARPQAVRCRAGLGEDRRRALCGGRCRRRMALQGRRRRPSPPIGITLQLTDRGQRRRALDRRPAARPAGAARRLSAVAQKLLRRTHRSRSSTRPAEEQTAAGPELSDPGRNRNLPRLRVRSFLLRFCSPASTAVDWAAPSIRDPALLGESTVLSSPGVALGLGGLARAPADPFGLGAPVPLGVAGARPCWRMRYGSVNRRPARRDAAADRLVRAGSLLFGLAVDRHVVPRSQYLPRRSGARAGVRPVRRRAWNARQRADARAVNGYLDDRLKSLTQDRTTCCACRTSGIEQRAAGSSRSRCARPAGPNCRPTRAAPWTPRPTRPPGPPGMPAQLLARELRTGGRRDLRRCAARAATCANTCRWRRSAEAPRMRWISDDPLVAQWPGSRRRRWCTCRCRSRCEPASSTRAATWCARRWPRPATAPRLGLLVGANGMRFVALNLREPAADRGAARLPGRRTATTPGLETRPVLARLPRLPARVRARTGPAQAACANQARHRLRAGGTGVRPHSPRGVDSLYEQTSSALKPQRST